VDDELPIVWPPSFYHRDRHVIFLFRCSFPVHRAGVGHALFTPPTAFFVKRLPFNSAFSSTDELEMARQIGSLQTPFSLLKISQQ